MGRPEYLLLDDWNNLIFWSDIEFYQVGYARYRILTKFDQLFPTFVAYDAPPSRNRPNVASNYAVGMMIDRGYGTPQWGNYLECYGHGRCLGLEGKIIQISIISY